METAAGRLLRMRNWNFFPIARKLIGRKAQDRHGIGRDWNIQVANIKGLMWPWALRDSPGRFSFNNSATAIGPWSFCCQVCFIRIPAICTGEGGGRGGRSSFFFIYFGFLKMFFILLFITSKRCAALCVIGDWKRAIDALSLSLSVRYSSVWFTISSWCHYFSIYFKALQRSCLNHGSRCFEMLGRPRAQCTHRLDDASGFFWDSFWDPFWDSLAFLWKHCGVPAGSGFDSIQLS